MRKFVSILISCLLLIGCTKEIPQLPEESNPVVEEPTKVDVVVSLQSIGYEKVDNYCIRKTQENGNDFLYVFSPVNGAFQMIELPSLRIYNENVRVDNDTYVNMIMNEELVKAKLAPSHFGEEESVLEVDTSSYLHDYTMINLHQVFLKNGYQEKDGFYVKNFDGYTIAVNVKGRAITLYANNAYYRYLSNHTNKKYTLNDGYCTYNSYTNIQNNCFASDINELNANYASLIQPELVKLGLRLYDLDLYYETMKKLKWKEVRTLEAERFPRFEDGIYTPDPDSENYVNLMLERKGAKFSKYTIQLPHKGKKAILYYEDKTFKLSDSAALYNFALDKGYYDGCSYSFKSGKGTCNSSKTAELKQVKTELYSLLDRAGLNMNELHLCFNITNKYDKNIASEVE